jgi:hypothetical protein
MKVSRICALLLLAILLAVTYALTPVSAGEHPWDSDQVGDSGAGDSLSTGNVTPDDGDDDALEGTSTVETINSFMGTQAYWLYMMIEDVLTGDGYVEQSTAQQTNSEFDTAGKGSSTGSVSN